MHNEMFRYQQIFEQVCAFLRDEHDLLNQHPKDAYERAKEIEDFVEDDIREYEMVIERIKADLPIEKVYSLYAKIIKRYEDWTADCFSDITSLSSYSKYTDYLGRSIIELGLCSQLLHRLPEKIIIVGSGSLPISAIVLATLLPNSNFDLLDIDPESNQRAQKIINKFSITKNCSILEGDAVIFTEYSNYDLVLVVSSVCVSTESKRDLILQISNYQNKQTVAVIRQPFQLEELFLARFDVPRHRVLKEVNGVIVQGHYDMFRRDAYIFGA